MPLNNTAIGSQSTNIWSYSSSFKKKVDHVLGHSRPFRVMVTPPIRSLTKDKPVFQIRGIMGLDCPPNTKPSLIMDTLASPGKAGLLLGSWIFRWVLITLCFIFLRWDLTKRLGWPCAQPRLGPRKKRFPPGFWLWETSPPSSPHHTWPQGCLSWCPQPRTFLL